MIRYWTVGEGEEFWAASGKIISYGRDKNIVFFKWISRLPRRYPAEPDKIRSLIKIIFAAKDWIDLDD